MPSMIVVLPLLAYAAVGQKLAAAVDLERSCNHRDCWKRKKALQAADTLRPSSRLLLALHPLIGKVNGASTRRLPGNVGIRGSLSDGDDEGVDEPPEAKEEEVPDAYLIKKNKIQEGFKRYKPKDNRDSLLYSLTDIAPPPRKLGLYRLEPNAQPGDCISAFVPQAGSEERIPKTFVIKKVSYLYRHIGGRLKMTGKLADVKTAKRVLTEGMLNNLLDA